MPPGLQAFTLRHHTKVETLLLIRINTARARCLIALSTLMALASARASVEPEVRTATDTRLAVARLSAASEPSGARPPFAWPSAA